MNTTRTGKIARLPKDTREEINIRLENGESGPQILEWLNHDLTAQSVLADHFVNPQVSEQNLSEWRQGGYQDWLRQQQTLALASQFVENSRELSDQLGHERLPDRFATLLAAEFINLAQTMLDEPQDTKQRWDCLCEINAQLSRLRRDDHRATQTAIQKERWSRQVDAEETAEAEAYDKEDRRQHVTRYRILRSGALELDKKIFGMDDIGRDVAAMSLEEEHNLKFGLLGRKSDLFALPKDPDEPLYPWRRWRKKSNPSEGRVPRVPNNPSDMSPPSNQSNPSTPSPTTSDRPEHLTLNTEHVSPISAEIRPAPAKSNLSNDPEAPSVGVLEP